MFKVFAGGVQGNAHENTSCSIKIMIISFRHSLNHYKFYKIALIIALINFKFTDLFIFYLPFILKFVLIFWEFNQFFSCKIFIFFYYYFKRVEQICHYFIYFGYICKNFDVFEDYYSSLINYNLNKILIYVCQHFLLGQVCEPQGEPHFLPPKFLVFYWSLNQMLWHLIQ